MKTQQKQVPKGILIFSVHVRNFYYAISDVSARSSAACAATASQLFPILVTQSLSTSSSLQTRGSPSLPSRSCSFRFHCQHQYKRTQLLTTLTQTLGCVLLVGVGNEGLIRTCFGIDLTFTFLLVPSHSLCAATAAGAEAAANLSISSVLSTHPYCISQMRFPLPRDNENENQKLIKQKQLKNQYINKRRHISSIYVRVCVFPTSTLKKTPSYSWTGTHTHTGPPQIHTPPHLSLFICLHVFATNFFLLCCQILNLHTDSHVNVCVYASVRECVCSPHPLLFVFSLC